MGDGGRSDPARGCRDRADRRWHHRVGHASSSGGRPARPCSISRARGLTRVAPGLARLARSVLLPQTACRIPRWRYPTHPSDGRPSTPDEGPVHDPEPGAIGETVHEGTAAGTMCILAAPAVAAGYLIYRLVLRLTTSAHRPEQTVQQSHSHRDGTRRTTMPIAAGLPRPRPASAARSRCHHAAMKIKRPDRLPAVRPLTCTYLVGSGGGI